MALPESTLAITGYNTNSISLQVGTSDLPDVNGYIIDIDPSPYSGLQQNPVYIPANSNDLEATFNYLLPGVLYRFALRIAQTGGSTPILDETTQRTRMYLKKNLMKNGMNTY